MDIDLAHINNILYCVHLEIKTLINFYLETDNPDSPASMEKRSYVVTHVINEAFNIANLLIEFTDEQFLAFQRLITEPALYIAAWSSVRAMLETGALASWLLEPKINAEERAKRYFALEYFGLNEFCKFDKIIYPTNEYENEYNDNFDRLVCDASDCGFKSILDKNGKRIGIASLKPSVTEIIKLTLDEEPAYRLLSCMTHGNHLALQCFGYKPKFEEDVGSSDIRIIKSNNNDSLYYLISIALKSFLKPVWYKSIQDGWDQATLLKIFCKTYDSLDFKDIARFWKE